MKFISRSIITRKQVIVACYINVVITEGNVTQVLPIKQSCSSMTIVSTYLLGITHSSSFWSHHKDEHSTHLTHCFLQISEKFS